MSRRGGGQMQEHIVDGATTRGCKRLFSIEYLEACFPHFRILTY